MDLNLRSVSRYAILTILAAIMTCQVESDYYQGDVSGQVLDALGNPLSEILVVGSSADISITNTAFPRDSASQKDYVFSDSTDISGQYRVSNSIRYNTPGVFFGCQSNDNNTSADVFYLELISQAVDTFVVLFASASDTIPPRYLPHYSARADTVIFLEKMIFEHEQTPEVYELPDIIIK